MSDFDTLLSEFAKLAKGAGVAVAKSPYAAAPPLAVSDAALEFAYGDTRRRVGDGAFDDQRLMRLPTNALLAAADMPGLLPLAEHQRALDRTEGVPPHARDQAYRAQTGGLSADQLLLMASLGPLAGVGRVAAKAAVPAARKLAVDTARSAGKAVARDAAIGGGVGASAGAALPLAVPDHVVTPDEKAAVATKTAAYGGAGGAILGGGLRALRRFPAVARSIAEYQKAAQAASPKAIAEARAKALAAIDDEMDDLQFGADHYLKQRELAALEKAIKQKLEGAAIDERTAGWRAAKDTHSALHDEVAAETAHKRSLDAVYDSKRTLAAEREALRSEQLHKFLMEEAARKKDQALREEALRREGLLARIALEKDVQKRRALQQELDTLLRSEPPTPAAESMPGGLPPESPRKTTTPKAPDSVPPHTGSSDTGSKPSDDLLAAEATPPASIRLRRRRRNVLRRPTDVEAEPVPPEAGAPSPDVKADPVPPEAGAPSLSAYEKAMIESLETGDVNFETLWKQYGGIGRPRDPSGRFVRHKDGMTRDLDLFDPPDESASRNKLKRAKGAGSGDDSAPGVDKSKPRNKLKRKK